MKRKSMGQKQSNKMFKATVDNGRNRPSPTRGGFRLI